MNRLHFFLMLLLLLLPGVTRSLGQVSSPEAREALLARTERFQVVQPTSAADRFANATDPFYSVEMEAASTAQSERKSVDETSAPPSDAEILEEVAGKIRPSGVMRFGPSMHLLFGERRVKTGEFISIQYQGQKYRLEVVEVDARAFVLRLNEEFISQKIQ